MADQRLVFGARVTHQKAAPAAVVTACGDCEFGKAAEAPLRGAVWDPGGGEGGGGPLGGALRQARLAALNVFHPGTLLLRRGRRHEEGLGGRADEPLVAHDIAVLHVLQLNIRWTDSGDRTGCVILGIHAN